MQRRVRSLVTLLGAAATALVAAQCGTSTAAPGAAADGQTMGLVADHGLADLVHDISPAQIRATDSALVSFGTRHTLSDTMSDTRGIGAARRYLFDKLSGYSKACGGCLHVEYDPAMIQVRRFPQQPYRNMLEFVQRLLASLPGLVGRAPR